MLFHLPPLCGIDVLAQDPLQVTLVKKTVAALLDCKIGSNLLTNIIILRFFLMFLQIILTCQSSGIELTISFGKYSLDEFESLWSLPLACYR